MDKKIYDDVLKLIDEVMEKESPQWSKKKSRILNQKKPLMDSLGVDSLLALEIVSRVEKKFGVKLKDEDFVYFDNMENIANLIEKKLRIKNSKNQKIVSKVQGCRKKYNVIRKKNEKI